MENLNTFTNVNEIKIYQSKQKLKSQGRHKLDFVWLIISFLFYLKTWNEGKCKSERVGAEIVWDGREEPRVGLAGCELYDDGDNDDDNDDDDDGDYGDYSDVYDYNDDESSLMFDIEVDIPPFVSSSRWEEETPLIEFHL